MTGDRVGGARGDDLGTKGSGNRNDLGIGTRGALRLCGDVLGHLHRGVGIDGQYAHNAKVASSTNASNIVGLVDLFGYFQADAG